MAKTDPKFAAPATAVNSRYQEQLRLMYAGGPDGPTTAYSHSDMCQVYLPYDETGEALYEVSQGKLTMRVQAAQFRDKASGEARHRGVPYGTRARVLLYLINELAVVRRQRSFRLCKSVSDLARQVGVQRSGRDLADLKLQLERLCTASFNLEWELDEARGIKNFFVIEELVVPRALKGMDYAKVEQSSGGIYVKLSEPYYNSLITKAVPLDKRAVLALQNNPMCLDILNWLTQRLCRIKPGYPHFVAWQLIREQFGPNYSRMRDFKKKFRINMANVLVQYPGARVEEDENRGWLLYYSKPPVAHRTKTVNVGGSDFKLRGASLTRSALPTPGSKR